MRMWPFQRSRSDLDSQLLLQAVSAASRNPALFGEGRIPDTLEGRFEALVVFATIATVRVGADPGAAPLAQDFSDRLFRQLDAGLREAGVGDLAVPKRMHKMAAALLGRAEVYSAAIVAGDPAALEAALMRNIQGVSPGFAGSLAQRIVQLASQQQSAGLEKLFATDGWRLADE